MIRSCRQSVGVEVTGILTTWTRPTTSGWILSYMTPLGRLYDVVVTNPVTAEVMRSNTNNRRAAWMQQQRTKERRYRVAATEAGMLLHGLAIDTGNQTCHPGAPFCAPGGHLFMPRGHCLATKGRLFVPWGQLFVLLICYT